MKKFLIFFFVLAILLIPITAVNAGPFDFSIVPDCNEGVFAPVRSADGEYLGMGYEKNCGICDIVQLVQNILNFLISFAVIVSVLMFVSAGFLYMTAVGNEEKIKSAHKIFTNVFIGLIFVLSAFLIVDTIMKALIKGPSRFGFWNEVGCGSSGSLSTPTDTAQAPALRGAPYIVGGTGAEYETGYKGTANEALRLKFENND